MLPFLIVGGVGLAVLLISLIVGDIFDHFDIGDGAISGTALGIAAVVFGDDGVIIPTVLATRVHEQLTRRVPSDIRFFPTRETA